MTRGRHSHHNQRSRSFTLVELLGVIALMTIAVSLSVLRLDGLTRSGRLAASARQIGAVLVLAQTQARTTGAPRLVEYDLMGNRVLLRAPVPDGDRWRWSQGQEFQTVPGVRVERVVWDGADPAEHPTSSVRVDGDGQFTAHALILQCQDQYAVVWCDAAEGVTHRVLTGPPPARDLGGLRRELVGGG